MARLSDYDCIGFDLDHTLIQYKLDNLYPVSQNVHGLSAMVCIESKTYSLFELNVLYHWKGDEVQCCPFCTLLQT